ncbi:MAG: leucine-rich repeat protein [Clostridia bacterium]|nr:leucine-rich repeat protein [Clostridia bacterium]
MKRFLALFLSALMLFSCFGAMIAAAEPDEPEPVEPEELDFNVELSVDGPYFYGEPFKVHAVVKDIKPGTELTSVEFDFCFDENYLYQSNSIYDIAVKTPGDSWENLSNTSWGKICVNYMTVDETEAATQDGDLEFEFELVCWSQYNYDLDVYVEEVKGTDADFNELYGSGNRVSLERGGRIKAEDIESVEIIRSELNEPLYEGERYIPGAHWGEDEHGVYGILWHGDYYNYFDNSIRVMLKDGTEITADYFGGAMHVVADENGTKYGNDYEIRGEIYELKYTDDQKKDDPWKAGIHTVHCDFEGFEFDYDVEILECPVESFTVEPLEIIEGDGRYDKNIYDYDVASWVSINAYDYERYVRWTAVLKDGTVLDQDNRYYNGKWYWPHITDDQVKAEWTVGNTYTAKANLMGFTADLEVTIIDTPVERIELEPVKIIEHTCGYEDYYYVDDQRIDYYYYNEYDPKEAVVYFKNGTSAVFKDNCVEYNGREYYGYYKKISPQDEEHLWTAGNTYKASVTIIGYTVEYDVEIIESPFVSAEIEPIVLIPEVEGYWTSRWDDETGKSERYFKYNLYDFNVTVHLNDGSSITGVNKVEYGGKTYYLDYNLDQNKNPLSAGNTYKYEATICGLPAEISVTVDESPIESIVFEECAIPVNTSGYFTTDDDGAEYFRYEYEVPGFTVYFKDGGSVDGDGNYFRYEGVDYYIIKFEDFQYFTHWEEGWSYDVEIGVGGYRGSFKVEITEFPVVSVTAEDVNLIAYKDGRFEAGYDGEEFFYYYYSPVFTVTFNDGNTVETDESWFYYEGVSYNLEYYFDQYTTHMEPGGTYEVEGSIGDVEFTFNVNIVSAPFKSISVSDVYVLDNNTYDYYLTFTLEYEDGSSEATMCRSFTNYTGSKKYQRRYSFYAESLNGKRSEYGIFVADGQTYGGDPLAPGDHVVPVMVAGIDTSFVMHVVESPVESISVDPIEVFEHARGDWRYRYDPETGEEIPYFEYYLSTFVVHVVFKDGSKEDVKGTYEYLGNDYSVSYSYASQDTEPWVLGGAYPIEVEFMGVTTETTATVVGSPVESIVIDPITLVENGSGYWTTRWDEEAGGEVEYFYYSTPNVKATVTFNDGRTAEVEYNAYEYSEGDWYDLRYEYPDQSCEPWVPGGTYTGTAEFMGFKTSFTVTIIKTPIESITAETIEIMVNTNGQWSDRLDEDTGEYVAFFRYYTPTISVTANFNDGTSAEIEGGYTYNGKTYYLEYEEPDQYYEPWVPGGTYYITVKFMGAEGRVPITILESPVESIVIEPISLIENAIGEKTLRYDDNIHDYVPFFRYHIPNNAVKATVTFKDGTVAETGNGMIKYGDVWYIINFDEDRQNAEPWTLGGSYEISAMLLGATTTLTVSIVPSPVEWLECPAMSVDERDQQTSCYYDDHGNWLEYTYFPDWSITPPVIYVGFTDGTTQQFDFYETFTYLGVSYSPNVYTDQDPYNVWGVGKTYEATLSFLGKETAYKVKVLEKPIYGDADGYTFMRQNGEITITGCALSDEELVIPETLDGYPVTAVSGLGFNSATKKIIVPDCVVSFGNSPFLGRYNVTEIVIGSGAEWLFVDMFGPLPKLATITVSKDNKYYRDDNGILYNTEMDTLIAYPLGKGNVYTVPKNVKNIDAMRCYYYENVTIVFEDGNENFVKQDGVTYNGDMTEILFVDSDKTGEYVMPDTVTSINGAFRENTGITRIVISEGVTELVYMEFMGCTALESVEFPTQLKTIGGGAFYGCTSLKSVKLPFVENVGYGVFSYCTSITEAEIDEKYDYVPAGLFAHCTSLEHFELSENIRFIDSDAFRGTNIKSITLPEGLVGLEDGAFASTPLASIKLPEKLESLGGGAFRSTKLTELVIPDSVEWVGPSVLAYCKDLESCTFGTGIETIPNGFFEGSGLATLTVPKHITRVGNEAFAYCSRLTEVKFENPNTEIGEGAFMCSGIPDIALPETGFIDMYCFAQSDIRSVRIPATVTAIAYSAFRWCGDLEEVTIPESVIEISESAFAATGLKTVRYIGDEDGWNKIEIGRYNEPLLNAERVYIAQLESEGVLGQILRSEYGDEVKLVVNRIDKTGYSAEGAVITDVYEVYFLKNGARFTPSEGMAVLLPMSEGVHASNAALFSFDGEKNATELDAVVSSGMIKAETTGILAVGIRDTVPDDNRVCKVRFVDHDGTVISEKEYAKGERITVPADPVRAEDDKYTYTFKGWDKEVSATAEEDVTYTAVYDSKPKQLSYVPGDVNGNGKIDAADYAMAKRAYLKTYTLSAEQFMRLDINKNGKIDASEYAMIKRHYLKTYVIPGAEGK